MKTKNIKLVLTCGALAVLGAMSLQGCSSSDDSSGGTAGTSSGGKGGTSAGGTSAGGKGGSGTAGTSSGGKGGSGTAGTGTAGTGTAGTGTAGTGTGGAGGAAGAGNEAGMTGSEAGAAGAASESQADLCNTFCADEGTTCTFGASTVAPYTDSNACIAACNNFTLGAVGVYPAGPTSGDTFACRRWHLSAAAIMGPVATHCPHTGTLSKIAYADATATGPCK